MSSEFEHEIDDLLDAADARNQQRKAETEKAKAAESQFVEQFDELVNLVIRPALEKVKAKLVARGRHCTVERRSRRLHDDGRVQRAGIAIHFEEAPGLRTDTPHVSFSCDERNRRISVYRSTIGSSHGGSAGPAGNLDVDGVTEAAVINEVMRVLRQLQL